MKKSFFFLAVLFCMSAHAQMHVDLGFGATRLGSGLATSEDANGKDAGIKSIFPMFKLSVGWITNNIVLEAVEQPTMSRTVHTPNYFGARIGYNINGLVPSIGWFFNSANADDKSPNKSYAGYALKYQWQVNDNAGLFAEGMYINKSAALYAGIHYQF